MYIKLQALGSMLVLASIATGLGSSSITYSQQKLPAIILVPGFMGSRLYSKKEYEKEKSLWLNISFAVDARDEFIREISLQYDPATHTTSGPEDVKIRVPGFGDTWEVATLDDEGIFSYKYMYNLLYFLEKSLGYNSSDLRAAPYDFRKAPNELGEYFSNLTEMVESSRRDSNGTVMIIAHSYGAPLINYYLNTKTPEWRENNIDSLITLSGAWGGSKRTVAVYTAGLSGEFFDGSKKMRKMAKEIAITFPSLSFLLPNAEIHKNETLVQIGDRKYAIEDIDQLFRKLNEEDAVTMHGDTKKLLTATTAPHVKLHCIYSTNVKTLSYLYYDDEQQFPDNATEVENDHGDGTVGIRSLELCNSFANHQLEPVISFQVHNPNVHHMTILDDLDTLKYVGKVIAEEAHVRTTRNIRNMKFGLPLKTYIPENVEIEKNVVTLGDYISKYLEDEKLKRNIRNTDNMIWELEKEYHGN